MVYLLLSGLSALLDWYSVWRRNKRLEYFFKPVTLILLILWFFSSMGGDRGLLGVSFLIGLAFSLAGDVFLMLPGNRFIFGLLAFLLAHIAYITAFISQGVEIGLISSVIFIGIAGIAGLIFSRLRMGLIQSNQRSLILPVALYVMVIAIMVWSAISTNLSADWGSTASILSSVGAVFFLSSDALLGWNRFVRPVPNGDLIVIMIYHLAQFLLSGGVILQLSGKFF